MGIGNWYRTGIRREQPDGEVREGLCDTYA